MVSKNDELDADWTAILGETFPGGRGGPRSAASESAAVVVWHAIHRIATRKMAAERRRHHTLTPTDLAGECYLKLLRAPELPLRNRDEFFAYVAKVQDNHLKAHANRRGALKRRGVRIPLDEDAVPEAVGEVDEIFDLPDALAWLRDNLPEEYVAIDLRFVEGLTYAAVGERLGRGETWARSRVKIALISLERWFER